MSQDFFIDPATNDWSLEGGTTLRLCADKKELIRQKLHIRLSKVRGEWFIDLDDGVPLFESVFGKDTQKAADTIYKSIINNTEGVTKIIKFSSEVSTERKYTLTFSVETDEGPIDDLEVTV